MDRDYGRRTFLRGCCCAGLGALAATGVATGADRAEQDGAPPTRWSRVYDGSGHAPLHAVASAVDDDGFLAVGEVNVPEEESEEIERAARVIKLDATGELEWEKQFTRQSKTVAHDVLAIDDGYVFVGATWGGPDGGDDAFAIEIDPEGNARWKNSFWVRQDRNDAIYDIEKRPGSGYICVGETSRFDAGWAVALTEAGEVDWSQTFSGGDQNRFNGVTPHPDGGFVGVGHSDNDTDDLHAWLLRFNEDGETIWSRFHRKESNNEPDGYNALHDVAQTRNGFIVAGGNGSSVDGDRREAWVMEVNTGGGKIWESFYEGEEFTELYSIRRDGLTNYLAGMTAENGDGVESRGFALKTDLTGAVQWRSTQAGNGAGQFNDFGVVATDELLYVGGTADTTSANHNAWSVKLGGEAVETPTPTPTTTPTPTPSPTPSVSPTSSPTPEQAGPGGGTGSTPTSSPTATQAPGPGTGSDGGDGSSGDGNDGDSDDVGTDSGSDGPGPAVGVGITIVALGAGGFLYNRFFRGDDAGGQVAGEGRGTGGAAPVTDAGGGGQDGQPGGQGGQAGQPGGQGDRPAQTGGQSGGQGGQPGQGEQSDQAGGQPRSDVERDEEVEGSQTVVDPSDGSDAETADGQSGGVTDDSSSDAGSGQENSDDAADVDDGDGTDASGQK